MRKPPLVLPADVYDTLELSAYAYGGIGGLNTFDYDADGDPPMCVIGHAIHTGLLSYGGPGLHLAITGLRNDAAVIAINRRKKSPTYFDRVSFQEWCKELGVVRGKS